MKTRQFTRWALFLIACWSVDMAGFTFAQEAQQPKRMGTQECLKCHQANDEDTNPLLTEFGSTKFAELNESREWHKKDIHRRSFDLIDPSSEKTADSNQRSREMCKKLGIPIENFGEQANQASHDCMTCHAGWESPEFPTGVLANRRQLTMGIGCESCHGNASEWVNIHHRENWARLRTPQEKMDVGMIPLNQPLHLAENCTSCHVGDRSVGRYVTHKMYVAGHPVLPNVEVATYRRALAKHWRPIDEESFPEKTTYMANHHLDSGFPETRQLIIGAITTFQITTRNLADGKVIDAENPERRLDFAAYDCASCHHDLKSHDLKSDDLRLQNIRQSKTSREIALGRPRPHYWSKLLIDVAPLSENNLNIHQKGWSNLCADLSAAPFGNRDESHKAYTDALGQIGAELAARKLTKQQARGFLEQLLTIEVAKTPDYFSAKQRTDAIVTIARELELEILEEPLKELRALFSQGVVRGDATLNTGITHKHTDLLEEMRKFDASAFEELLNVLKSTLDANPAPG